MAGRALRGMLSTADYKDGKALKSCHTEFYKIHPVRYFYKALCKESLFSCDSNRINIVLNNAVFIIGLRKNRLLRFAQDGV